MMIRLRNYPLSVKLTLQNNGLVIGNIFVSFAVCIAFIMLFGGPGLDMNAMSAAIIFGVPIVVFIVLHILINKHTDQKYNIIMEDYKKLCSKLIHQDTELVKDKELMYPAEITFRRLATKESKFGKQKYIINGTEYVLKNGETIQFTTNRALNSIQAKSLGGDNTLYFTVDEQEKMTIEYALLYLKNVERNS